MDLMPSAFGCSSESSSQPHRGGCIFRKLQQTQPGTRLVQRDAITMQPLGRTFQLSKL